MKIILLQDIPKTGKKGDVLDISGGYAKNVLIPKKMATFANEQTIKKWKDATQKEEKEKDQKRGAINSLIKKLQEKKFQFKITTGKKGEVFESVHDEDIRKEVADLCNKENPLFTIEDIKVKTKPIKEIGDTKILVNIGRGLDSKEFEITITVLPRE